MWAYNYTDELCHHGVAGQKWGVRNGPPYPLSGGVIAKQKQKRLKTKYKADSTYSKKHFDKTIKKGTTLTTLSYDPNRTKNVDMFYAAYKQADKDQYEAWFNKKVKDLNTGEKVLKYRINNEALKDIKVASEDTGIKVFEKLYSTDNDFYNYVKNPNRMLANTDDTIQGMVIYNRSRSIVKNMSDKPIKQNQLDSVYRLFNYQLPMGVTKDSKRQSQKFFNELKKEGYSAVFDTHDGLYNGYKTKAPVIVFDMEAVALRGAAERTTIHDKHFAEMRYIGRKVVPFYDGEDQE